MELSTQQTIT